LNIVIGAGSVRILDGIIQTFVNPDDEVLTFENSFVAYGQIAEIYKRKCFFAKQKNFRCRIDALLPLISERTKIIFIANPNNPTGTIITHAELKELLEKISPKIFVVADEAYLEYVTDKSYPDSIGLLQQFPNLIIVRTFSKAYGLAGLRVGYAIADKKIIDALKQNRLPFSINYLAEDAAITALEDKAFIRKCARENEKERHFLYEKLIALNFNTVESQANFLYLHFDSDDEKEKIYNCLSDKGIMVCNMKIFGQEKSLRIGIGNRTVNKKIVELLSAQKKNKFPFYIIPSSAKLK